MNITQQDVIKNTILAVICVFFLFIYYLQSASPFIYFKPSYSRLIPTLIEYGIKNPGEYFEICFPESRAISYNRYYECQDYREEHGFDIFLFSHTIYLLILPEIIVLFIGIILFKRAGRNENGMNNDKLYSFASTSFLLLAVLTVVLYARLLILSIL